MSMPLLRSTFVVVLIKCYFIVAHIEKKNAFCTAMYMLRLTLLRLLIAKFFGFFCSSFNNTILIVVLSKQWRRDSSRSAGDCRQTYEPCLLRWRCRGRDVDTLLVKHSTSGLCVWVAVSFFCVLHWINVFGFFVLKNIFDDYLFQESVTAQVNVEQMHIGGQKYINLL